MQDMRHRGGEPETLRRLRWILYVLLVVGIVGMGVELLLSGHYETREQQVPLWFLAAALVVVAWQGARPGVTSLRLCQLVMVLSLSTGLVGIGYHYAGNEATELEASPRLRGWALVGQSMTSATPILAPGSLILLGLVGLAYAYGHPLLADQDSDGPASPPVPSAGGDADPGR